MRQSPVFRFNMSALNLRTLRWHGFLLVGIIALAAGVLFFFDPAEHAFYPVCFFHRTTGLLCPGCGSLRAVHQLSHGHLAAAFRVKPLLVVCLPFLAWCGGRFPARKI